MTATITERVAAGAAFLDEQDPEWWREGVDRAISLDRLSMGAGDACILGQRCPLETLTAYLGYAFDPDEYDDDGDLEFSYHAYAGMLTGISRSARESLEDWAVAHGFNRPFGGDNAEYTALTAEWKRFITERRSA